MFERGAPLRYSRVEHFFFRLLLMYLIFTFGRVWTQGCRNSIVDEPLRKPSGLAHFIHLGFMCSGYWRKVYRPYSQYAAVLYIANIMPAVSVTFIAICHLLFFSLLNSHGFTTHTYQPPCIILVTLSIWSIWGLVKRLREHGGVTSRQAWIHELRNECNFTWFKTASSDSLPQSYTADSSSRPSHDDYGIYWVLQVLCATYVLCAFSKLYFGGSSWLLTPENISVSINKANLEKSLNPQTLELTAWAQLFFDMVDVIPIALPIMCAGTLLLEGGAPLMLHNRLTMTIGGMLLISMHMTIAKLMMLSFDRLMFILFIYLVNLPGWLVVLARWLLPPVRLTDQGMLHRLYYWLVAVEGNDIKPGRSSRSHHLPILSTAIAVHGHRKQDAQQSQPLSDGDPLESRPKAAAAATRSRFRHTRGTGICSRAGALLRGFPYWLVVAVAVVSWAAKDNWFPLSHYPMYASLPPSSSLYYMTGMNHTSGLPITIPNLSWMGASRANVKKYYTNVKRGTVPITHHAPEGQVDNYLQVSLEAPPRMCGSAANYAGAHHVLAHYLSIIPSKSRRRMMGVLPIKLHSMNFCMSDRKVHTFTEDIATVREILDVAWWKVLVEKIANTTVSGATLAVAGGNGVGEVVGAVPLPRVAGERRVDSGASGVDSGLSRSRMSLEERLARRVHDDAGEEVRRLHKGDINTTHARART